MTRNKKSTKKAKSTDKKPAPIKLLKTEVKMSNNAEKEYKKLPQAIKDSFQVWVKSVTEVGLAEVGKIKGYNHEHLRGDRKGQRSARLNKSYRVIFTVENGEVQIVNVEEINNHKY